MEQDITKRGSQDELEQWQDFLRAYSQGGFPADQAPWSPPLPTMSTGERDQPFNFDDFERAPIYEHVEIDLATAGKVKDFYARYGFLPPPRGHREPAREQCVEEYDLYSADQVENFQSTVDLIHAFYGGIVTLTLFRGLSQQFVAIKGDPEVLHAAGLKLGMQVLPETSMCGHSVLWTDQDMVVSDLTKDWRYRGNPYVAPDGGLRSYRASVVTLQIDPTRRDSDERVAIGVINVMQTSTFDPESAKNVGDKVLKQLTRMLERQLRSTWDGAGRLRAAKARAVVSELTERVLVHNHGLRTEEADDLSAKHARLAVEKIEQVLLRAGAVTVVDLRGIVARETKGRTAYVQDPDAAAGRHDILAQTTTPGLALDRHVMADYLERLGSKSRRYDADDLSGLETSLPSSTQGHIVVPFMTEAQPLFCIVVTTDSPHLKFSREDVSFINTIGVILGAYILQRRVVAADASKTTFLSSISHELRTPLHGILSGLELVRQHVDDEAKEAMEMVESSATTLDLILNDVLDFARISRREPKAEQEVDLQSLTRRTMMIGRAEGRGEVDIVFESTSMDWTVRIDRARFQRILLNAITNAIKHTKDGSIVVRLELSKDLEGFVLTVQDTGCGIPEAFLKDVFRPFTKANPFAIGTGLGLYIVRGMVQEMGGTVDLQSRVDEGTRLTVACPVHFLRDLRGRTTDVADLRETIGRVINGVLVAAPKGPAGSRPDLVIYRPTSKRGRSDDFGSTSLDPTRILVVEDNDISRKILVRLIQKQSKPASVKIETAVDGIDALEKFRAFAPQIVLTDVSMPRMNGVTAAREMRRMEQEQDRPKTRIYAITGLGSSDIRLKQEAMMGDASLDGWFIKGQDNMSQMIEEIAANSQGHDRDMV